MPKFFSSFRRLRKESAGSVLILVVALIVILALLGTAFVATARIDRYTAGASASNAIMTQQLQSLQSEICSDIANGLYDSNTGNYRPIDNNPPALGTGVTTPTYGHFDSNRWYPGTAVPAVAAPDPVEWDTWLADRLPTTSLNAAGGTDIVWRCVTRLPGRITDTANLVTPMGTTALNYNPWGYFLPPPALPPVTPLPTMSLIPTAIAITYPRSTGENPPKTPKVYPAFQRLITTAGVITPDPAGPFLAADADGDGIADSLLFDLGVSSPSSAGAIEYFAAVRIVDNNSAVNLNTAWSRKNDFKAPAFPVTIAPGSNLSPSPLTNVDALGDLSSSTTWTPTPPATGAANLGWLPSHVGLLEMLDPNEAQQNFQEMAQLNLVRFGNAAISSQPYESPGLPGARTDYSYLTLGDALWNQLGRRIQNPGYNGATVGTTTYQAVNDNGELSFRFNLLDPSANPNPLTTPPLNVSITAPSVPEQKLNYSLYTDVINWTQFPIYNRWGVYPADKALYWFDYNFNTNTATTANLTASASGAAGLDNEGVAASNFLAGFFRNPRAQVLARNPLSNATPIHSFCGITVASSNNLAPRQVPVPPPVSTLSIAASYMDPYPVAPKIPIRASINTDSFGTLWRSFWNVMCDDLNPGPNISGATGLPTDHTTSTSFGVTPYTVTSQIYTPPVNIAALGVTPLTAPIAPASLKWSQYDQLLIRAAVAAVNAEGLRDPDRQTVISRCIVLPDGVTVEVYSNKLQPYIIAYNQSGAGGNPTITIANPTNSTINMTGWVLAYYQAGDASAATPPPAVIPKALITSPTLASIGPHGTVVVTIDLSNSTNQAIIPPTPPGPALTDQILLMRPRLSTTAGTLLPSPNPSVDNFNEVANGLWDYDPIDYVVYTQSFASGRGTTGTNPFSWSCVQAMLAPQGGQPPAVPVNVAPNQIFNDDFPGPYAPGSISNTSLTTSSFPYGSFSRLGDVLKVPFIGSYRVMVPTGYSATTSPGIGYGIAAPITTPLAIVGGAPQGGAAVYFVPISMDAAACYTGLAGEQVGHFCPISSDPTSGALPSDPNFHSYDWAKKLFDYFTVIQNPGNDFSPNVNPGVNNLLNRVTANWSVALYNLLPGSPPPPLSPLSPNWPTMTSAGPQTATPNGTIYGVTAIANTTTTTTPNVNEENVGIDGLININTASWQVLASLPMVPFGQDKDANGVDDNIDLAKAIVQYRDVDDGSGSVPPHGHGPFKSVFDLNNVVTTAGYGFQNGWGALYTGNNITAFDSTPIQGDFSPSPTLPIPQGTPPGPVAPDLVSGDFEKKFLTLSNISNLITTRSDTFTCYVVVQGWLNAGSSSPILVSQQRMAFIANRVATGPGSTTVQTTNLPSAP